MEVKGRKVRATIWDTGIHFGCYLSRSWPGTFQNSDEQLLPWSSWNYLG